MPVGRHLQHYLWGILKRSSVFTSTLSATAGAKRMPGNAIVGARFSLAKHACFLLTAIAVSLYRLFIITAALIVPACYTDKMSRAELVSERCLLCPCVGQQKWQCISMRASDDIPANREDLNPTGKWTNMPGSDYRHRSFYSQGPLYWFAGLATLLIPEWSALGAHWLRSERKRKAVQAALEHQPVFTRTLFNAMPIPCSDYP